MEMLETQASGDITAINNSSLYSPTNTGIRHTTQGTNDGGVYGTTGNVVIEIHTGFYILLMVLTRNYQVE